MPAAYPTDQATMAGMFFMRFTMCGRDPCVNQGWRLGPQEGDAEMFFAIPIDEPVWTTCRATIGIPGWWMLLGRLQQRGHRQRRLFHAYGSISPCSCAGVLVVNVYASGSSSPYAKAVRSVRHAHAISKRDLNCRVLVKLHTSCIKHMKNVYSKSASIFG